jgi:hypothetical protein
VPDKRAVRRDELVRLARRWLASDFNLVGREWAYRNIERAVYAEELLRGEEGGSPADYKLFVFSGKVRLIQVAPVVHAPSLHRTGPARHRSPQAADFQPNLGCPAARCGDWRTRSHSPGNHARTPCRLNRLQHRISTS